MNNLGDFRINNTFEANGRIWDFFSTDIANYRGITTHLNEIWLDWHNVLDEPEESRMHMYLGGLKETTLAVKRMRMETWQQAIVVLDGMMVDVKGPLEPQYVLELLHQHKIPRPTYVVLPTANPSLCRLLDALGIQRCETTEYKTEWKNFSHIAAHGGIVRPKRYLKNG